ncbi:DNA polymerase Y family protein [uncultured Pseudacidovorax sp.]|uniref:DNA polymerase Y family protein n=1 Tax=uncultured Pseudacidovorax sp. TaxID=679313 RepID=UPI0025F02FDB|nr:DNA polymerase Y family protein [uncultured Pseudacidovorax sp.]
MHWLALQWLPEPAGTAEAAPAGGSPQPADASPTPESLGWWALQFTPHVAWLDEALMLEVSACERLWGGRRALMRQIGASVPPGLRVRQVTGATSLEALARLRLYMAGQPQPARLPDDLPLETLSAAAPHLQVLARLGCRTWGDVAALPRGPLVRRFGVPMREALDLAWGLRPDGLPWLQVPDSFEQRLELPMLAQAAPELLWAAQRLLGALRLWLQARQRGVLAIELWWTLDLKRLNGAELPRSQQIQVRTAEPTQDMAHLRRLLAERLALTQLIAPTGWLRLRSLETADWQGRTRSLLPPSLPGGHAGAWAEDGREGEPLHQLLEKLSARLGARQVLAAQPVQDHRPEGRQQWRPAAGLKAASPDKGRSGAGRPKGRSGDRNPAPGTAAAGPVGDPAAGVPVSVLPDTGTGLFPAWLLREPRLLPTQDGEPCHGGAPLRRLVGPQRLETAWWESGRPAARDYYIAQDAAGALFWIYRERATIASTEAPVRWFLQGIYA